MKPCRLSLHKISQQRLQQPQPDGTIEAAVVVVEARRSPDPIVAASPIEVVAEEAAATNVEVAEIEVVETEEGVPSTRQTHPIVCVTTITSMVTRVTTVLLH